MKKFIIPLAIVAAMVCAMPVLALSDITDALYTGQIAITNTGTATTNVSTVMSLSSANLISGLYMGDDCLDSTVMVNPATDAYYMPAPGDTNNWCIFVPTAGAGQQIYNIYTGGGTDMTSAISYFPAAAGMSVADHASMEPVNNFEDEVSGYVDTSLIGRYLVSKPNAYRTTVSAAGEITSAILGSGAGTNLTIYPSGVGNETSVSSGTGTHWQAVSDSNDATYIGTSSTTYQRDLYSISGFTPGAGLINSVTFYYRIKTGTGGQNAYAKPSMCINGTNYDGTEWGMAVDSFATNSQVYNTSPVTSEAWKWGEIDDLQIGVSLKATSGHTCYCSEVYIVVNYILETVSKSVTATGITSGNHTVKTTADATDLKIYVDGVEKNSVALAGASVPDNANNWIVGQSNVMPYINYYKHTVSGTLVSNIEWNYDDAAPYVFTDLSGNSNDATATLRTTSSDADVAAALLNFGPITEAEAPSSGSTVPGIFTTAPDEPDSLYEEDTDSSVFPLVDLINDALDTSDTPRAVFYYPVVVIICIAVGIGTFGLANKRSGKNKGTQSLLMASIAMAFIWAIFWQMNWVAGWVLIFFAIEILTVLIAERRQAF